jgi:hypothetical protein
MHIADLATKYSTEAQNLDVIELAAIYQWLLGVNFESDAGGKKRKVRESLKRSLKERMGNSTSFDELFKKRNAAYKNQTSPFTDTDALFSQEVVPSEDPINTPTLSFRSVARPSIDSARSSMLLGTMRSDGSEVDIANKDSFSTA